MTFLLKKLLAKIGIVSPLRKVLKNKNRLLASRAALYLAESLDLDALTFVSENVIYLDNANKLHLLYVFSNIQWASVSKGINDDKVKREIRNFINHIINSVFGCVKSSVCHEQIVILKKISESSLSHYLNDLSIKQIAEIVNQLVSSIMFIINSELSSSPPDKGIIFQQIEILNSITKSNLINYINQNCRFSLVQMQRLLSKESLTHTDTPYHEDISWCGLCHCITDHPPLNEGATLWLPSTNDF